MKGNPLLPIHKIKNKATQRQINATFASLIFGERIIAWFSLCFVPIYCIRFTLDQNGLDKTQGWVGDMIDCAFNRCPTEWSRVEFPVTFCASSQSVRYDEALAGFSPIPLCRFFSCKALQLLAVYWRYQPNAVQFFNEVLKWNFSFVKTLPRTSHAGPQCGDILRVRYPVPTPECTHEEILRWKVQMWLHYPSVSLQSIPLPRTGGQCSRNYEWSEVRKTWWWIWAEFSALPENTSQRCSRRSHLHVRKGNF